MCNNHVEKYVNDEASRKLYEILLRRALGFTDLFEKAKFALFWLIHHIANFRVYHVEHFPLESLFLYHIRRIKKKFLLAVNDLPLNLNSYQKPKN